MALFLLHARYGRTCNICGDHWLVTRRQAKGSPGRAPRPRRTSGPRTARTYDIAGSTSAFNAAVEIWQAYRRCPHCGIDDFSQEPVRRAAGD